MVRGFHLCVTIVKAKERMTEKPEKPLRGWKEALGRFWEALQGLEALKPDVWGGFPKQPCRKGGTRCLTILPDPCERLRPCRLERSKS